MKLVVFAVCIVGGLAQVPFEDVGPVGRPTVPGVMGPFLSSPGLLFEPKPEEGNLILVRRNQATALAKQLAEKLQPYYEHATPEKISDCHAYKSYRPSEDWTRACGIPVQDLGTECVQDKSYGYTSGKPCVLLYLDRIFQWLPEVYNKTSVPEAARQNWGEFSVTVTCEGTDPPSKDNLGTVTMFPKHGFHVKYFPDTHQKGFLPPLVFAQFETIEPAVAVDVECKIWAKNAKQDKRLHAGVASFQLLVDF